ncbi:hypothetical protein ENBRE01_0564 [Enteropsectra breve]|nr:hypothetical protein ENBRE01_0564 [Enteropsectra breve]
MRLKGSSFVSFYASGLTYWLTAVKYISGKCCELNITKNSFIRCSDAVTIETEFIFQQRPDLIINGERFTKVTRGQKGIVCYADKSIEVCIACAKEIWNVAPLRKYLSGDGAAKYCYVSCIYSSELDEFYENSTRMSPMYAGSDSFPLKGVFSIENNLNYSVRLDSVYSDTSEFSNNFQCFTFRISGITVKKLRKIIRFKYKKTEKKRPVVSKRLCEVYELFQKFKEVEKKHRRIVDKIVSREPYEEYKSILRSKAIKFIDNETESDNKNACLDINDNYSGSDENCLLYNNGNENYTRLYTFDVKERKVSSENKGVRGYFGHIKRIFKN